MTGTEIIPEACTPITAQAVGIGTGSKENWLCKIQGVHIEHSQFACGSRPPIPAWLDCTGLHGNAGTLLPYMC